MVLVRKQLKQGLISKFIKSCSTRLRDDLRLDFCQLATKYVLTPTHSTQSTGLVCCYVYIRKKWVLPEQFHIFCQGLLIFSPGCSIIVWLCFETRSSQTNERGIRARSSAQKRNKCRKNSCVFILQVLQCTVATKEHKTCISFCQLQACRMALKIRINIITIFMNIIMPK